MAKRAPRLCSSAAVLLPRLCARAPKPRRGHAQGTQAGIEAVRRASETANETVRRTTQVVAEGQRQIAQEAAQTFQEVSRKMAQVAHGTSEEVRRLATLPHAAQGGLHDMRQGVAGLVEGVVQTNLRATHELFRLVNRVGASFSCSSASRGRTRETRMQNTRDPASRRPPHC